MFSPSNPTPQTYDGCSEYTSSDNEHTDAEIGMESTLDDDDDESESDDCGDEQGQGQGQGQGQEQEQEHMHGVHFAAYSNHRSTTNTLSRKGCSVSHSSMVPYHQEHLTPVLNSFETRHVIIRSRDRDLFTEHLLQFGVQFGEVHRPTATMMKRGGACNTTYSQRATYDRFGVRRGCVVSQTQKDVADVCLTRVVFPKLAELAYSATTLIANGSPLMLPQELYIELEHSPTDKRLLGTAPGHVRCSTFWCVPEVRTTAVNGDHVLQTQTVDSTVSRTHSEAGTTVYKPSNTLASAPTTHTQHHARYNYSSKMQMGVHLPSARTIAAKHRFDVRWSPDVSRLCLVAYNSGTNHITCTAVYPSDAHGCTMYVKTGDVVSIRDLCRSVPPASPSSELEESLWSFFCTHGDDTVFQVIASTAPVTGGSSDTTSTFTFDARLGCTGPLTDLPSGDVEIALDPSGSCALNEGMQFTVGLEFTVATRRLSPSVSTLGAQ